VGRPSKKEAVRRRIEAALLDIALGQQPYMADAGDERGRFPTVAERIKAIELLLKYDREEPAGGQVKVTLPGELGEWLE